LPVKNPLFPKFKYNQTARRGEEEAVP